MASPAPATPVAGTLEPSPWLSPFPSTPPLELGTGPDLPIWSYLLQFALVTVIFTGAGYAILRYVRDKLPGFGLAPTNVRGLRVVDRVAIDQARSAFIVNVGKRYWLLAAAGESITTVAELAREDVEQDFDQLVEKETNRP